MSDFYSVFQVSGVVRQRFVVDAMQGVACLPA